MLAAALARQLKSQQGQASPSMRWRLSSKHGGGGVTSFRLHSIKTGEHEHAMRRMPSLEPGPPLQLAGLLCVSSHEVLPAGKHVGCQQQLGGGMSAMLQALSPAGRCHLRVALRRFAPCCCESKRDAGDGRQCRCTRRLHGTRPRSGKGHVQALSFRSRLHAVYRAGPRHVGLLCGCKHQGT